MSVEEPRAGVRIIVIHDNQVLLTERIGPHLPGFCILGGKVELGQSLVEAAASEALQEAGIKIIDPVLVAVTDNLKTFEQEGVHIPSFHFVVRTIL